MEKINHEINYFNRAAYDALIAKVGTEAKTGDEDAADDLSTIKRATDSFFGYVQTVDITETRIKVARFRCETEEYQEVAMEADRARHFAHEAVISNCSLLNRVAKFYGIDAPVFRGNLADRNQVSDFCLEVTVVLFQGAKEPKA